MNYIEESNNPILFVILAYTRIHIGKIRKASELAHKTFVQAQMHP